MIVGTLSAPLLALFCLLSGTVLELAVGSPAPPTSCLLALSLRGVPRPATA